MSILEIEPEWTLGNHQILQNHIFFYRDLNVFYVQKSICKSFKAFWEDIMVFEWKREFKEFLECMLHILHPSQTWKTSNYFKSGQFWKCFHAMMTYYSMLHPLIIFNTWDIP